MGTNAADVLYRHVVETVGRTPAAWPGGYPNQIELALVDAIFSIRARYGNEERKTGVRGVVHRWRTERGSQANDLKVLAACDPDALRSTLANNGRLSGRYKAEVVVDAAHALVVAGIVSAEDFLDDEQAARAAYLSVKGCGPVTWRYLRMLVGRPDVKPDTWVMKFVQDCLPDVQKGDTAAALLADVAQRLDVDLRQLDHAIWNYQRSKGVG